MVAAGAAILDVGGESTRPGAARVPVEEQTRRVVPVIAGLRRPRRRTPGGRPQRGHHAAAVAEAAAEAGQRSSTTCRPGSTTRSCSASPPPRLAVVLMHKRGEPRTSASPFYEDVVSEVAGFLAERAGAAADAGVPSVVLDPGSASAKRSATTSRCWVGSRGWSRSVTVLLGTSRRASSPGSIQARRSPPRLPGSLATAVLGLAAACRCPRSRRGGAPAGVAAAAAVLRPDSAGKG